MRQKILPRRVTQKSMDDLDEENFDDSDSDCGEELESSILEDDDELSLDALTDYDDDEESLFTWKEIQGSETKLQLPFMGKVGPKVDTKNFKNEFDFFKLFFTNEILEILVDETNRYASDILNLHGETTQKKSHGASWKQTDRNEILKFLGLVLLMGHIEKDNLQDYWATNDLIETPIFRKVMPRDRFFMILKFLHFSDNKLKESKYSQTYDRLWKIRKVFECFNRAFKEAYDPTEHLSFGEVIIKYKGRVLFDQYIPKDQKQWGIKMYKIADATGYTYDLRVYLSKDELIENFSSFGSHSIVYSMAECIKDKGHKLFMDKFFSSPELFCDLLEEKKINSCGTIHPKRKHFPKNLGSPKMKQGDVVLKFCNGMTALCWKDRKQVYMLSNMHNPKIELVGEEQKRYKRNSEDEIVDCTVEKVSIKKPKIVSDYNQHKGYVNLGDRMASTYSFTRKTKKWTDKLFFSLINIAVLNAFLIFKSIQTSSSFTLKDFRMNLINSMLKNINDKVPKHSVIPRLKMKDASQVSHWPSIEKKRRRRCAYCTKKGLQKRTTTICKACNVALCIDQNCFEEYHTIYLKIA